MRAYVKKDKWDNFKNHFASQYGFTKLGKPMVVYTKQIDRITLCVFPITRELVVLTPMGMSPFVEVHKELYKELIYDNMIFYKKGKFD